MSDRFVDRGKNSKQGIKQASSQKEIKGPKFVPGMKPQANMKVKGSK